eukprot:TRINITY_DN949_c2_g1_i1.p1 TRINITY_DN949_c2_g1~~TRINITY_DN949_c2_g1_i1.p1  ORF type:complete len:608 (+),score=281.44 TRINITY_DN949_c2_g1_i1:117-1940(+)
MAVAVAAPPPAAHTSSRADGATSGRAYELLATLDAAKRQKVQNEKMRNMVFDCEDLLNKLHAQSFSVKQRLELDRAHSRCAELLKELESSLSYSHLRKFNVSRYMVDCAQEMQVRDLHHHDEQPDVSALRDVLASFQALRGQGPNAAAFTQVIDHAVQTLQKAVTLLEGSKLNSQEWAPLAMPLVKMLGSVMSQQPASHCLHRLEEQCKRLEFTISEIDEQQREAVDSGEMAATEKLYYQKVTIQEALADTVSKKFDCLAEEEHVAVRVPLEQVRAMHAEHQQAVQRKIDERDTLKQRCEADLRRLNAEVERANLEDYNATKMNANLAEKHACTLKENLLEQDACWSKIESLEQELQQLGQLRTEAVTRHIKALEQNESRRVEYQHFMDFALQHKRLLELTIHNCELAEETTDLIDEVVSAGCNAIESRMRETEREIADLRLGAHEHYLQHFRQMYLTLGDLRYKKEANIQALEEKIQVAHMQQEMYMESLNPKAKEYSQLKKDLGKMREELDSQVSQIREKETLYIEAFKPTEKALTEAGREFLHPVQELLEINQKRKDKLTAYHRLVTGEGEGDEALEAERQQIERDRQLLLQDRPRTSGGTEQP